MEINLLFPFFSSFRSVLLIFAFIIFQSIVYSRSSTHLNIIACANYIIVFQKRMLIEQL